LRARFLDISFISSSASPSRRSWWSTDARLLFAPISSRCRVAAAFAHRERLFHQVFRVHDLAHLLRQLPQAASIIASISPPCGSSR